MTTVASSLLDPLVVRERYLKTNFSLCEKKGPFGCVLDESTIEPGLQMALTGPKPFLVRCDQDVVIKLLKPRDKIPTMLVVKVVPAKYYPRPQYGDVVLKLAVIAASSSTSTAPRFCHKSACGFV